MNPDLAESLVREVFAEAADEGKAEQLTAEWDWFRTLFAELRARG